MAADKTGEGPPNPEADQAAPIGARLRAGRERVGLSESQVATSLNLDASVIAALEAGDFDSLGAPIFVKGHLRNYARLVKMDPAEIIAAYEHLERNAPPDLPTRPPSGVKMDERGGRGSRIAWVILALIVAAIGYWLYRSDRLAGLMHATENPVQTRGPAAAAAPSSRADAPAAESNLLAVQALPPPQSQARVAPNQSPAIARPSSRAGTPAVGLGEPRSKSLVVGNPAPATGTASPAFQAPNQTVAESRGGPPRPETSAAGAASMPTAETMGQVRTAEAEGGLPIALRLTGDSWVDIEDASGKRLYYGLAHGGQTLYLTGRPPLSVFLGNAANVRVLTAGNEIETSKFTRGDETARFTIHKQGDNPAFAESGSGSR